MTREFVRVSARTHYIHVVGRRIHSGIVYDVIIPRPEFQSVQAAPGRNILPLKLMFEAYWIYDLTDGKILKNKTGKSVVPCIDAEEVDGTWLHNNGYSAVVQQPGHDLR